MMYILLNSPPHGQIFKYNTMIAVKLYPKTFVLFRRLYRNKNLNMRIYIPKLL